MDVFYLILFILLALAVVVAVWELWRWARGLLRR